MSWLPTIMKKFKKMNELEWSNIIELYFRHSMAANYSCWSVWPKIKLIKAFIVVIDTCKNNEDPSRNESIRLLTTLLSL